MDFRDQWNIEMAMQVLASEKVDGVTWTEAAKWLLLYGPHELRQILLEASSHACGSCFPELKASAFTKEGEPLFRIDHIAEALGSDPETLKKSLQPPLEGTEDVILHEGEDTFKVQ
ncbi:MAG: hypothetical protein P8130_06025 [Deltaproteobacteria bacterium]